MLTTGARRLRPTADVILRLMIYSDLRAGW